jgi:hypothetical protein
MPAPLPTFTAACAQAHEAGAVAVERHLEKAEGVRSAYVLATASGKALRALEASGWARVGPAGSASPQRPSRAGKRALPSAPVVVRLAVNPDVPYDPDAAKRAARAKGRGA